MGIELKLGVCLRLYNLTDVLRASMLYGRKYVAQRAIIKRQCRRGKSVRVKREMRTIANVVYVGASVRVKCTTCTRACDWLTKCMDIIIARYSLMCQRFSCDASFSRVSTRNTRVLRTADVRPNSAAACVGYSNARVNKWTRLCLCARVKMNRRELTCTDQSRVVGEEAEGVRLGRKFSRASKSPCKISTHVSIRRRREVKIVHSPLARNHSALRCEVRSLFDCVHKFIGK